MMRSFLTALIVLVCLIVALSLSGCAQCIKSHDVPYTQYVDHCMQYDGSGNCIVNMPLPHTGYETHCDEWSDK